MSLLPKSILRLRPGAIWSLNGDDYEDLEWNDAQQTKPTKTELENEILKIEKEFSETQYQRSREKEYPDFREYLDGVVKGDQEQISKYIAACLAVKAKYPKP